MNQTGNTINPGNIQHFADSAANAIQLGQRQFFTPPDLAAALFTPLKNTACTIATDLMAGSGHLLTASKRKHLIGIDVDERSTSIGKHVYQADVTRYFSLAHNAGLDHDMLLLNPPFSLQWYLDRLSPLASASSRGVKQAYQDALSKGKTIDSTLGTFLIALELLSYQGEGYMICNADTARRLIGDPSADKATELLLNVWCWLDIPNATYENQQSKFPTAVLYFSASHGMSVPADRKPLHLIAPSADPQTVENTLQTALSARPFAYCGRPIRYDYNAQQWDQFKNLWNAVRTEYHQLYHGDPPAYNLSLRPDGTIRTHLDPYRKAAYHHNRDLLIAFREMEGESPTSLVVQQASRSALKHAIQSGAWRVEQALVDAVNQAISAYQAVRAPFYQPEPVQSLGWLDEESEIVCERSGITGFQPGTSYPLQTWIEDTKWEDKKMNLEGETEKLSMSGRELVVCLTDDAGEQHHFHVRRDDADLGSQGNIHHHHIKTLISHFHIPTPMDVAATRPDSYLNYMDRLKKLESIINAA